MVQTAVVLLSVSNGPDCCNLKFWGWSERERTLLPSIAVRVVGWTDAWDDPGMNEAEREKGRKQQRVRRQQRVLLCSG